MSKLMSKLLLPIEDPVVQSLLPPKIILNHRQTIEADQVPIEDILVQEKDHINKLQLVSYPIKSPPVPIPKFPINITWYPNTVCFHLATEPVVIGIWIWNLTERSINFNCCGLWNEAARCGASWRCFPRTKIWLPSGLRTQVFVRAAPRELSPIHRADAFMQIAAGHMRDIVTGYFSIPIHVIFSNYVPPPPCEGD